MAWLYPTKARLSLLAGVANLAVTVDITSDVWRVVWHPYAPDQWQDQVAVTARIAEMERAGWVSVDEDRAKVRITDAGRGVLAGLVRHG